MNGALDLSAAFRTGERSAVEITRVALDAVKADNLGCFWKVLADRAIGEAEDLDRRRAGGEKFGQLAAVPFVAKDCFDVTGLPTTCGISGEPVLPVPSQDAAAIAALGRAGAILVAKASMDQLAWGMTGASLGFPPTHNPVDPSRMPGGSSGGSAAAVASGVVPLALGTDAGGSVRQPAAWCGVFGFKPTLGSIETVGCAPMAPNLDTVGVFGRSIADVTACFTALAERPSASDMPSRPRVGVLPSAFEGADAAVSAACEAALKEWEVHGAELVEVDMPWPRRGLGRIYSAELAASWTDRIETDDPRLLPTVRAGLEHGGEVDAVSYMRAVEALELVRSEATAAVADLDVVVGPTSPIVAPPLGDPDPTAMAGRNTRVFNGLGWPSISIPVEAADLPVGLQLAAVSDDDTRLLAIASQLADVVGN